MSANDLFTQYICAYTIARLPGVDEAAFESAVAEVIDKLFVSRRNIAVLDLGHEFLKDESSQRADRYTWLVRVGRFELVSEPRKVSELDVIIRAIDEDVRRGLEPWGIPVSMTLLRELGRT
jgi:hypothetical protein